MIKGKLIKGNASLSLSVNRNNSTNESLLTIECDSSSTRIMEIKLTAKQFTQLMGGLGHVKAEMEFINSGVVGKKLRIEEYVHEMPEGTNYSNRKEVATEIIKKINEGDMPEFSSMDSYLGSQSSFFTSNGREWFRTTIRHYE